jgi:hypothetical protein
MPYGQTAHRYLNEWWAPPFAKNAKDGATGALPLRNIINRYNR